MSIRVTGGLLEGQVVQHSNGIATIRVQFKADEGVSGVSVNAEGGTAIAGKVEGSSAVVQNVPCGGPYNLEISGTASRLSCEFYVGEVWILAGQSNMEGVGDMADAPEPEPLVRAFTMARRWTLAREPLHHLPESPDFVHSQGKIETSEMAEAQKRSRVKGVGPGLWFARLRRSATGIPQGLVACAHGGTSMREWSQHLRDKGGDSLYGSMIKTLNLLGGGFAGLLWYQGCNDTNADDAQHYTRRMQDFVAALRADTKSPQLPVVVVQIGRCIGRVDDSHYWNQIQEAQRTLHKHIQVLATVPALDLEMDDWIHVSGKAHETLARRILGGLDALRTGAERFDIVGCNYSDKDPGGVGVEVEFRGLHGALCSAGRPLGFSICDDKGNDQRLIARTRLEGNRVFLRSTSDELHGLTVAYGAGCDTAVNVFDASGNAIPAFSGVPITGLPPVSKWLRHWELGSARTGSALDNAAPPNKAGERLLWKVECKGWWYLDVSQRWKSKDEHLTAYSHFRLEEDMVVELRIGNDILFRCFVDGTEVLADLDEAKLTSSNIDFERKRKRLNLTKGVHEIAFLLSARRDGGMGICARFARMNADKLAAKGSAVPVPLAY